MSKPYAIGVMILYGEADNTMIQSVMSIEEMTEESNVKKAAYLSIERRNDQPICNVSVFWS